KVTAGLGVADGRGNVVAAERRLIADIKFAAERPAGRKRQVLLVDFAVVGIFDSDVDGLTLEQLITFASPLSQDTFEIDLLRRTIDRTIGVDIAGEIFAREHVVFAALAAEVKRVDVGNDEVVALARHDQISI